MSPSLRMPQLPHFPPLWRESRFGLELADLRRSPVFRGHGVPDGGGRAVLLIPGFLAGDGSLATMTHWLRQNGYHTRRAGIRANVGCSEEACARLEARLEGPGDVAVTHLASAVTVRSWRDGDRMRPVGLGGTKSLQDLFTDRKVPRALRRTLPVVESDGEIVWVAGVAVDERFASAAGEPGAVALSAQVPNTRSPASPRPGRM